MQANNTQISVVNCPTYYYLVQNECVWNNSVLEFSFYNNMSNFTDLSGNVKLSIFRALPVFQQSRGLYFNGINSGFFMSGLVLSPDFTWIFWLNLDLVSDMVLIDKPGLSLDVDSLNPKIYLTGTFWRSNINMDRWVWYEAIYTVIAGTFPIVTIVINRLQTYLINLPYSKLITYDQASSDCLIGTLGYTYRNFIGWIVYFVYAPYHIAFPSLTFTVYPPSQLDLYMCNIYNFYNGSACQSCFSSSIIECYGPLHNNAFTCAYPMTLCNDTCFCNNNYYWNGTTCLPCYSSCLSCKGSLASDCLLNINTQICSSGYFYQSDTCEGITYESCFVCDVSCLTCSGTSSSNCTSCIQNATFQSNSTCSCSQGWFGTPPQCSRIYFTAGLSVNASNFAKIVFSEPVVQFITSNISVTIDSLSQSFSIIMVNSSTYLIEIVFVKNVTQNTILQIEMLGSIVSQSNSLLSTKNLNGSLYARTLGGIQECFGSFYNNCYTCAYPMSLCTNKCYCNKNYYWSGSTCASCDSSCSICNGNLATNCLLEPVPNDNSCMIGYFFHSDTCEGITYSNCFPCDPTCLSCVGPSSNNCASCIQNASIQSDNSCLCSQGWTGTPPLCTRNCFSAALSVNASNAAFLVFSEPLSQQLSISNFSVSINSYAQNFSITIIDSLTYLLQIVFVQNITKNSNLEVSIPSTTVSQANSLISASKFNAALYARTLGGIQECFESAYENCYTCASPMSLCTNICYCNNNFYWNGSTCMSCDSSCSICNGPSVDNCLLKTIYNNNVCANGYFFHSNYCEGISYNNCFPCDSSCFTCEGPSSSDCTACIQNATLQSNQTCTCSQGWSGLPPICIRNYFQGFLSVNANDAASIIFSEALADQLNSSNINVFMNDVALNFSITMIDKATWLIEPVYAEDVLANSALKIQILSNLVSEKNSLLSTFQLNSILYPLKSQILAQQILAEQIATVKGTTQQAATASGVVLASVSLLNFNLLFFFQFLNAAEILMLIKFFNLDLDPLFLQFISSLDSSFQPPSIFDYFVDSNDGAAVPENYQSLEITTSLFLINSGSKLTIFLVILGVLLMLFIFKGIVWLMFKKNIKNINKSLIFNVFTRFWIQTIFNLSTNSLVGIYLAKFDNITQIVDFSCCILAVVIDN